jgi:hypothetical protein
MSTASLQLRQHENEGFPFLLTTKGFGSNSECFGTPKHCQQVTSILSASLLSVCTGDKPYEKREQGPVRVQNRAERVTKRMPTDTLG